MPPRWAGLTFDLMVKGGAVTPMVKNLEHPDELRTMPNDKGQGAVVVVGDTMVVRGELQPGWRWSNDLRPLVGTTSCEFPHTGVMLEGRMHVEMDDGTSFEVGPGDVYVIPPGHDAWVVGDEAVRSIDWSPVSGPGSSADFAKPPAQRES